MSDKDKIRKQIESLQEQIDIHRKKIAGKTRPYYPYEEGEIKHWETEISGWEKQISSLNDKL